jgi:hypothetical protein
VFMKYLPVCHVSIGPKAKLVLLGSETLNVIEVQNASDNI